MKKLGILFMAVMIAAIAGCAGDDSSGSTGDMAVVQDLQIDATSTGRNVVLVWSAVDGAAGYKVYFKADATGSYVEAGEVTGTTFNHSAAVAGEYSVKAIDGDNSSSDYATAVSTMPSIVNVTYSIYDNYAPADYHSGFIFGETSGQTGFASEAGFRQDIYAFDDSKGDMEVSLYSGDAGTYGNGYNSNFQLPASSVYGNCDPAGFNYGTSIELLTSDSVIFVELVYDGSNNAYAKMYGMQITDEPISQNGTEVSFMYEYQSTEYGFTLFTSNAN